MIDKLNTHYSFENPASVYDEEALTALELAGRQGKKINEVVEAQNALQEETDRRLTAQEQTQIPETVESSIQAHIQGGTFDKAIDSYTGNLEARVDNLLGSVTEGSTTMDTEVIDGRLDVDGATHPNLGGAIRHQINRVLFEARDGYFYNRLNPNTITPGVYVAPNGGLVYDNELYYASDYIPVKPKEILGFYNRAGMISYRFVSCYDSAKNPVEAVVGDKASSNFEVPSYVYYIRVSFFYEMGEANDCCVISQEYGKFIPYGSKVIRPAELAPSYNMNNAYYYNRIDRQYCIEGCYPNNVTGLISPNANYVCSNYIPVLIGETLAMFDGTMKRRPIRILCVYNKNGSYLSDLSGEYFESFTNTSNDVLYVRIALYTEDYKDNNAMVAEISTPKFLLPGEAMLKTADMTEENQGRTNTKKVYSLASDETVKLDAFPSYLRKNLGVTFKGDFNTFTSLKVGHGGENVYSALWFEITPTSLIVNTYTTKTTSITVAHGLTISGFIVCNITYKDDKCYVDIITKGGRFTHTLGESAPCGTINAVAGQNMLNVSLSATCADFASDVWMFGDSYFGLGGERVIGQLENLGYSNYLVDAQPGINSANSYSELIKTLEYGTPKFLVWYLGMNDGSGDEPFKSYFLALKELCESKGITLIVNKVPTVPGITHEGKHELIDSTEVRFIDSHKAVGANSDGVWMDGLLSGDNVHPTIQGAIVLASQILVDVPEIMSYGRD